jgi:hypothetical protein
MKGHVMRQGNKNSLGGKRDDMASRAGSARRCLLGELLQDTDRTHPAMASRQRGATSSGRGSPPPHMARWRRREDLPFRNEIRHGIKGVTDTRRPLAGPFPMEGETFDDTYPHSWGRRWAPTDPVPNRPSPGEGEATRDWVPFPSGGPPSLKKAHQGFGNRAMVISLHDVGRDDRRGGALACREKHRRRARGRSYGPTRDKCHAST